MSRKKTHLLILSEESRGKTIQESLETFKFSVITKTTVFDGLKAIDAMSPDLIIIGSDLVDATICEVCHQLRQSQYYVPLIIVVEYGDEYDRIVALEIGADDYIAGAVNKRELVARIRAHLRRAYDYSKPAAEVLRVGDLILDCTRGQAFIGQRLLDLTPIEFRLLKFLIHHRNHILSRSQILNQVWGYGWQPHGEAMVNVNICRLRQKIEVDPTHPKLIITVRGVGYRFASDNISR